MTSQEFYVRYQVLEALALGSVRSYRAKDVAGREVIVHFVADPPAPETPLGSILASAEDPPAPILERLQVDEVTVLVTEVVSGFESLEELLSSQMKLAPEEPTKEPGEYTRLFSSTPGELTPEVPTHPAPTPPLPPSAPPPHAAPPPPPARVSPAAQPPAAPVGPPLATTPPSDAAPKAPEPPGEFTRLFGAGSPLGAEPLDDTTPPDSANPSRAAASPPVPTESAPAAPPPASPRPPAQSPPTPGPLGEFTQLFGAKPGTSGSAPPVTPRPSPVPPPKSPVVPPPPRERTADPVPPTVTTPTEQSPGEFTRLFGASSAPPPPATPPPAVRPDLAQPRPAAPKARPTPPPPRTAPLPSPAPEPPPPSTPPGEFTKLFGASGAASSPKPSLGGGSPPGSGMPSYREPLAADPQEGGYNLKPAGTGGSAYQDRLRSLDSTPQTPASPKPVLPQQAAGPSEYTRVISAASLPSAAEPSPPAAASAAAAQKADVSQKKRRDMIIVGVVLAVVVVVAVVVLMISFLSAPEAAVDAVG